MIFKTSKLNISAKINQDLLKNIPYIIKFFTDSQLIKKKKKKKNNKKNFKK